MRAAPLRWPWSPRQVQPSAFIRRDNRACLGQASPPLGHNSERLLDCTRSLGTHAPVHVDLSKIAQKQLAKVPARIARKLALWADLVRFDGLQAARSIPGFNDHPLKGRWQGYRAIRLSEAYRAIYILRQDNLVEAVLVEEVSKHDY